MKKPRCTPRRWNGRRFYPLAAGVSSLGGETLGAMTQKSRCPNPECRADRFEVASLVPKDSDFEYTSVQCAKCGTVVGVVNHVNVIDMLKKMAIALKID